MTSKDSSTQRWPRQRDIWLFDPDPVKGKELGKKVRPCLVVSCNALNRGPSGIVIVVPITSVFRNIPSRITIEPPEGGLQMVSYAVPEQIRSISTIRLVKYLGTVRSSSTFTNVLEWVSDFIAVDS